MFSTLASSTFALAILAAPVAAAQTLAHRDLGHLQEMRSRRLIVQTQPGVDLPEVSAVDAVITGRPALDALTSTYLVTRIRPLFSVQTRPAAFRRNGLDRYYVMEMAEPVDDVNQVATHFGELAELASATPDEIFTTLADPNDPSFGSQWSLHDTHIKGPSAWDLRSGAFPVPIAVCDTGIDLDHPDLTSNRWKNTGEIASNGIDDDGNGFVDDRFGYDFANNDHRPDDDAGHGTHVAGILGAKGNNGRQISGVCWTARVMGVKVLDAFGGGLVAWIASGVVYAADNGARVINLSLGGAFDVAVLRDAISYASDLDILCVAAAGNSGTTTRHYPGAYAKCMAIINTTQNDRRNGGSTHGNWCDMSAPGTQIVSLWVGGGLASTGGTSMASPHVAGAAALIRSYNPDLPRGIVRQALNSSAKDVGPVGFDAETGWGRLNLFRALKVAGSLRASATTIQSGEDVHFHLSRDDAANHVFLMVPTRFGRSPGWALSNIDPGDARFFPLNYDPLGIWPLAAPGNGVFSNFFGVLDGNGEADALFRSLDLFPGQTLNFAFLTFDPANTSRASRISNAHRLEIQ